MSEKTKQYSAFIGQELIARGPIEQVVRGVMGRLASSEGAFVAVFDHKSGARLEIDFRGSTEEVLARLAEHPLLGPLKTPEQKRGRGRPKLGVVSREVSLLPAHWEWLATQRGGASATLRRLVMEARRGDQSAEKIRQLEAAAHRFMWDMAGDLPGFEEASRAFFAHDYPRFESSIAAWPADFRAHLALYVEQLVLAAGGR